MTTSKKTPRKTAVAAAQDEPAVSLIPAPEGYALWLADLKSRIHTARQRAALTVNRELVLLYWGIGRDILRRQAEQGWGAKVIDRLSHDLRTTFPGMKGLSRANLMYMRAFASAWPDAEIVQQAVGQLPWGHNLVLLTRLKAPEMRLAYAQAAIEHGWSRDVLNIHIETRRLERSGKAVTNFAARLPAPGSDLAHQTLKDPYWFDFLDVGDKADEREIESALVNHVTQFLLELGAGFAFVGRQVHLEVGGDDFFIDLLFYHLRACERIRRVRAGRQNAPDLGAKRRHSSCYGEHLQRRAGAFWRHERAWRVFSQALGLRCYVVIELKAEKFKPEHLGQLGFYLTAVDRQVKTTQDAPTIGLLLCKSKNEVVAEYALGDKTQPMGVAEYKLLQSLPKELQTSLPSIEQIERELGGDPQCTPAKA
jgi:predicted nuclease of restriction endonuclease-like (RecB) superfamily